MATVTPTPSSAFRTRATICPTTSPAALVAGAAPRGRSAGPGAGASIEFPDALMTQAGCLGGEVAPFPRLRLGACDRYGERVSATGREISIVIPTYNRAAALRLNFPHVLAIEDVGEIVVVIDGSNDETPELLAGFGDE